MVEQWVRKGHLTVDTYQQVNWDVCEIAMKSLNLVRHHWVAKHVLGHVGVGMKMAEWKMQENKACPQCRASEDTWHVWTCQAPEAQVLRLQHF
jgi:hypothetical protein